MQTKLSGGMTLVPLTTRNEPPVCNQKAKIDRLISGDIGLNEDIMTHYNNINNAHYWAVLNAQYFKNNRT